MKHLLAALAAAVCGTHHAAGAGLQPADTLRHYDMEEAVVTATPKETSAFRRQPVSASFFGSRALSATGAANVKGIGSFAPNFYMPDYGSRITSAVYIRGIGSRINTPAVGLYVDNVPYADKSAYDFSFIDVDRVDVLRGPQGTLYGRNSMGGLVRVTTADPLRRHGTDVRLEGSGRNGGRSVKAVTYLHPSDRLALSAGGFYEGEEGFFRNSATGHKADGGNAAGGKVRTAWLPSERLRLDLTASYEYSDEAACPYFLTRAADDGAAAAGLGLIAQNRPSGYRRQLLNASAGLTWLAPRFVLSSISAWQYLDDRLFMDQDFTAADIFSLEQTQLIGTFSEELSLKSRGEGRWQWTSGAFLMYQTMTTRCPVTFYADGVDFLNRQFAAVLPARPPMSLALADDALRFGGRLRTPAFNAALFHQSTVKLGAGLSVVAGVRADYDSRRLRLASGTAASVNYRFAMPAFGIDAALQADAALGGRVSNDSWQLLPKLALQYDHRGGRGNVYVAVAKGYRSGGYNVQSYSDLSQNTLRRAMMLGVMDYSVEAINRLPLPEASKQAAIAGLTGAIERNLPAAQDAGELAYRPEQSWNYELGGHLSFLDGTLGFDYTLFCATTRDQQLARFAESGMGRVMVNAGRSRSFGAETALAAALLDGRLNLTAAYGYTNAKLLRHHLGTADGVEVDYSGNRVPFAPEHTLGLTAAFRQPLPAGGLVRAVGAAANLAGAGRIWWDEANSFSQPFHAQLGASLRAELSGGVGVEIWGRNLTATRYTTFAFESLGNRFAQYGNPRHFGASVTLRL